MESWRKEFISSSNSYNSIELCNVNIPFDYPVLVSGDYDEAVLTIAETIVNSIIDINGGLSLDFFYSNSGTLRMNVLSNSFVSRHGILNVDTCPEDSHMYSSIRYARASIPETIVIPHVIGSVSRGLYELNVNEKNVSVANSSGTYFCTKEKRLNRQDYEKAMRMILGLTPGKRLGGYTLWNKLNRIMSNLCRLRDNPVDISYNDVVISNTDCLSQTVWKV